MDNFVSTELGNIPIDWKCVNFTSLFQCKQGVQTPVHVQVLHPRDGYKRFIRIIDLTDSSELPRYIPDPGAIHHLTNDDLFMVRYGTPGLVGFNYDGIIANNLFRLIPKSKIHSSFYYHYISFRYTDIAEMSGSSTMPAISFTALANFKILVPPFPEQQSIATALSDADAYIESLEKLIAKKRAIKKGVMQELLTGKRRLPGFSGEWETKKLGEIANIKTGGRNNQDKVEDGEYPFFVRSETVERINTYSHDCEAILVPGEGGIGNIFHYINGRFDVHQRVYAITQFAPVALGKYVYLYIAMNFGAHAMQNSVKATVDSLRLPTFQDFLVSLPPTIEEQRAISDNISDIDSDITTHEAKLSKARLIKQGMMQELLTGRIRLI